MSTENLQISDADDDCDELDDGTVDLTGTHTLRDDDDTPANQVHAGIRFPSVVIPKDAIIVTATLELYLPFGVYLPAHGISHTIYAEAADDAAPWLGSGDPGGPDGPVARSRTGGATWTVASPGTGWESAPDIASEVQGVVNRAGWVEGNALALLLIAQGNNDYTTLFESGGDTNPPKLTIEYVERLAPDPAGIVVVGVPVTLSVGGSESRSPGAVAASAGPSVAAFAKTLLADPVAATAASPPATVVPGVTVTRPPTGVAVAPLSPALSVGSIARPAVTGVAIGGPSAVVAVTTTALPSPPGTGVQVSVSQPRPGGRLLPDPAAAVVAVPDAVVGVDAIALQSTVGTIVGASAHVGVGGAIAPVHVSAAAVAAPPTTPRPGVLVSPGPGSVVAAGLPEVPTVETVLLPAATALVTVLDPQTVIAGGVASSLPAAVAIAAAPDDLSPGCLVAVLSAGVIAQGNTAVTAVIASLNATPHGAGIAAPGGLIVAGGVASSSPAGAAVVPVSLTLLPGSTASPATAAVILEAGPALATAEASAIHSPACVDVSRLAGPLLGGSVASSLPAAVAIAAAPDEVLPGASQVAYPAGVVLQELPTGASIEGVLAPDPAGTDVGHLASTLLGGGVASSSPTAVVITAAPDEVLPGASQVAYPAGVLLQEPPTGASIEGVLAPDPAGTGVGHLASTLFGGGVASSSPAAVAIGAAPEEVLPGVTHAVHPAGVLLQELPTGASIEGVLAPDPAGIISGEMPGVAALGWDLAIQPGAHAWSTPPTIAQPTAWLSSPPQAVVVHGLPESLAVGVTVLSLASGATLAILGLVPTVGAASSHGPGASEVGATSSSLSHGQVIPVWPGAIVVLAPAPAGLGAVHIFGPDCLYVLDASLWHVALPPSHWHCTLESDMTRVDKLYTKTAAETKDLTIDCAGALAAGETITAITATTHAPSGLTITGVTVNDSAIDEPGERPIQIGEAIRAFVGGGTPLATYTITFTYTTSGGQTLEVTVQIRNALA